ncbi:MAG: 4-hydroxy-tetrahydrodipicolinate reductase [Myxococcota bacterium]
MAKRVKIILNGACGRMSKEIIRASASFKEIRIVGGVDVSNHPRLGADLGEIAGVEPIGALLVSDLKKLLPITDVIVDFSSPQASLAAFEAARAKGTPIVCGTTGFSAKDEEKIKQAAEKIPVILSSNMSLGMHLLALICRKAAEVLSSGYDIEIYEAHHRHKKDAPSGSALLLADALFEGRGQSRKALVFDRSKQREERDRNSIGIASARGGDIIGIHKVLIAGEGEYLELSHTATSRQAFAQGALTAALWVADKEAGMYTMRDVLRL